MVRLTPGVGSENTPRFKHASDILSFPNLSQVCGGTQVLSPRWNPEQWFSNFSVLLGTPGRFLGMLVLGPYLRSSESEIPNRVEPECLPFNQLPMLTVMQVARGPHFEKR